MDEVAHAVAMLDAGRAADALRIVGPRLAQDPDDVNALRVAAGALSGVGRHRSAIEAAEHVVRLTPDDADAWRVLAFVRRRAGRLDGAIDAGRRVVELAPWDWAAHANLANLWSDRDPGNEAAITAADEAVRLGPNAPEAHLALGTALLRQDRIAPAVDALRTALRLDPQNEIAQHNLAIARMRGGDPARAVTDLAGLAARNPTSEPTLPALRTAIGRLLGQVHTALVLGVLLEIVVSIGVGALRLDHGPELVVESIVGVLILAAVIALLVRTRRVLGAQFAPVLRFVLARDRVIAAWAIVDALVLVGLVVWPVFPRDVAGAITSVTWMLLLVGLALRLFRSAEMRAEARSANRRR